MNIKIRIARPTNDINKILLFYRDGLGLEVLSQFEDHDGFSGVMLGHKNSSYHLEFTCEIETTVVSAPTKENLLVFYLPDKKLWLDAIARMENHGFFSIKSHNPYWDRNGKTFEDFEKYRVVLVNENWTK